MTLRAIFMGTPDFSVPCLTEIVAAGHEVVAVYTQPPRPAGRGMTARKSPVHVCADKFGLPVLTPRSLRGEAETARFADHRCDVAVVAAYGLILPKPILEGTRFGCFNLHASCLPRWRGAAPIQRAVMAGDRETAVMVMKMEEGLDTGPVCLAEHVAIGQDMTAGELHDTLAVAGASLMVRALAALERGTLEAVAQSEDGVTYAKKIEKSEAQIDFSRPAEEVHNLIRGLSPFPGAWFETSIAGKPERIKVLRSKLLSDVSGAYEAGEVIDEAPTVACGSGAVRLVQLQRAGKRAMSGDEFLRGFPLRTGARL